MPRSNGRGMTQKKVELRIYGMTCADCVRTVEDGLKSGKGVKDVSVDIKGTGIAYIEDSEVAPEDLLRLPVFGADSHYKAQIHHVE
jgi:copper chaperone